MQNLPDITTPKDIEHVLGLFYSRVVHDETIGYFFTEVVPLDLETHIPLITNFWESVVFGTKGYRKNVMEIHQHIHHLSAIKKEHLDRWVAVFHQTIDENFSGSHAELMKQRASSIASLMDIKLNHSGVGVHRNRL
jgi:hemoglobin